MEERTNQILFSLLRSAISNTKLTSEELAAYSPELLPELLQISRMHDVVHLLALGLRNNGLSSVETAEIEKYIFKAVFRYERLNGEFEQICQVFETAGVMFMPLKGLIVRDLYPERWMRTSCDLDILVREEDLERAIVLLSNELNYFCCDRGTHDVTLITPTKNHIELHFNLMEDGRVNQSSELLKSVWTTATLQEGCRYRYKMSDEMFYFYHMAHMAKHFETGGCGIRPFLDLWIMEKTNCADAAERTALLEQGRLLQFYKAIVNLVKVWFDGAQMDPVSLSVENFVIRGGVYGTESNNAAVRAAQGESKIKNLMKIMFLSRENLAKIYPVLEKAPILYPFYQVKRWFRIFDRKKRNKVKHLTGVRNALATEEVDSATNLLRNLGLAEKC